MTIYFDKYGRIHDKPSPKGAPSSNNGWLYSAYFYKLRGYTIEDETNPAFLLAGESCAETLQRHPYGTKPTPPISRDEILGLAYLKFLKPKHLKGWSFSPYPVPKFSLKTLLSQLWQLRPTVIGLSLPYAVEFKHRNYFWENNLDQLYRFAFSVPLQDRAFLLECWGETKSIRYAFYKQIAKFDAKFSKPKNGIHWLKYGGEERKKIMQQEFPQGHPLKR
jgi:hypothetical protein